MIPDIADLTGLPIHWFGVFLAAAFWAAGWVAAREFARKGLDPDVASSSLVWAIVGGLLGARLWLVLSDPVALVRDPVGTIFTGSGWVFYGGLAGGALAVTILFRRRGVPFLQGADAVAPGIVLAQAIGRVGCQVSGDGDWGVPSDLPWAMSYPYAIGGWPYPEGVRVHPTPVYECVAYLAVFAFLWRRRRAEAADGTIFGWYLVLASAARFLVEFVRINDPVALGLTAAQLTSLALVATGVVLVSRGRAWRPAAA
jgi:phosphatidylglycerol:prolipoprotein diacylglycerol transferase